MRFVLDMRCEALRDIQRSGLRNYFLEIVPSWPLKAEYALVMVRQSVLDLDHLTYYRVTFEELDGPGGSVIAAEDPA
jgi:hypothetical protein